MSPTLTVFFYTTIPFLAAVYGLWCQTRWLRRVIDHLRDRHHDECNALWSRAYEAELRAERAEQALKAMQAHHPSPYR